MNPELLDVLVMDARGVVSVADLARMCELSLPDLDELIDYGAVVPVERSATERLFSGACVMTLRKACSLRRAFDLDLFTVVILLGYLDRIEALEGQLRTLTIQGRCPTV